MIAVIAALLLAALSMLAYHFVQRRRLQKLAEQIEDFLASRTGGLAFSVREDSVAPLHNAIAELENQYAVLQERLSQESCRTGNLIADISHQLKTPLASLRLFCEMDGSVHVDAQLAQIERMEQLIYALLRLERLCVDGYAFRFEEREAREIVQSAWQNLEEGWPEISLHVEGSAVIRCDARWLEEAFLNLLKNACEHEPAGGTIRVKMETVQSMFYCTVEDDGGGVTRRDLPHLFERFYRTEAGKTKGSGLGLAIVREIIERHHGHIRAENTETGLRMTISIPILCLAKS